MIPIASAIAIVEAIGTAIKVGGALIQVGRDAAPVAKLIYDTFVGKKEITQAELDAFTAETDKLSDELDAPLPEDE